MEGSPLKMCVKTLFSISPLSASFPRTAENLRQREEEASTLIQSRWRSYTIRDYFERMKNAVLSIQAGDRGHLGRKRAMCMAHLVSPNSVG